MFPQVKPNIAALDHLNYAERRPICDKGVVDFLRHRIVEDRPAPNDLLVDHIAETVRPGYHRGHDLLRPQQVVAYTRRMAE